MSISSALGERKEATVPQGTISYRERGSGEPIVFIHGLLVNGDLWRKVVPELSKDMIVIQSTGGMGTPGVRHGAGQPTSQSRTARSSAPFGSRVCRA